MSTDRPTNNIHEVLRTAESEKANPRTSTAIQLCSESQEACITDCPNMKPGMQFSSDLPPMRVHCESIWWLAAIFTD